MAIQFKDITTYSQGAVDRTPRTYEAHVGGHRLVVSRHRDYGTQWHIRFGDLLECDIEDCFAVEAQRQAVLLLKEKIVGILLELS